MEKHYLLWKNTFHFVCMFLRYFENKFYRASFVLPIDYGTNEQSVTKQLISELGQQCDKV